MKKLSKFLIPLTALLLIFQTPLTALAYTPSHQMGTPEVINGEEYDFAIGTIDSPTSDKFEDSTRSNKIIIWSLFQGEADYILEDKEGGGQKRVDNPHYTWVKWTKRPIGVKVRNSSFEGKDGSLSPEGTLAIYIDYTASGTEVYHDSADDSGDNFQFLEHEIKQYGNADRFALYKNVYYVENGDYLFSQVAKSTVEQPKGSYGKFVNNVQSYVVCPRDYKMNPFEEAGFSDTALGNEWVTLDGGKEVTVYVMFGSADWCYENYPVFQDWIALNTGEAMPTPFTEEEEVPEEEAIEEEEEEIDPDSVPLSIPVIVEEEEEEVDNTQTYIKLGVFAGVCIILGVGGFVGYKAWKKKNDEYL